MLSELRKALSLHIADLRWEASSQIVDYGCADMPYKLMFPEHSNYKGADLEGNPNASIILNANGTLPISDQSVDAIVSTQVLEHVSDPRVYLNECHRTLKPGGVLILSTHGIWPYHADPVDYWRWTAEGLKLQLNSAGLQVERMTGIGGMLAIAIQLWQSDSAWRLPGFTRGIYCYLLQRLAAGVNRLYSQAGRERNSLVYLVTARKLEDDQTHDMDTCEG